MMLPEKNHLTNTLRCCGWWFLLLFFSMACQDRSDVLLLSAKANSLWEKGEYADAARNLITLAEIYPHDPLTQESLLLAANLYQHFLFEPEQAIRFYQHLLLQYPKSSYSAEARENLAILYEEDASQRYRALQIYRQLLRNTKVQARRDDFQFKIAFINLRMGRLDQARFEFKTLLEKYPESKHIPEAYYLVGYSYYLEDRFSLALVAFRQTVKDFPENPFAERARFFMADTLEEKGKLRSALVMFRSLKGPFPNSKIVKQRIKSLRARMQKGVR